MSNMLSPVLESSDMSDLLNNTTMLSRFSSNNSNDLNNNNNNLPPSNLLTRDSYPSTSHSLRTSPTSSPLKQQQQQGQPQARYTNSTTSSQTSSAKRRLDFNSSSSVQGNDYFSNLRANTRYLKVDDLAIHRKRLISPLEQENDHLSARQEHVMYSVINLLTDGRLGWRNIRYKDSSFFARSCGFTRYNPSSMMFDSSNTPCTDDLPDYIQRAIQAKNNNNNNNSNANVFDGWMGHWYDSASFSSPDVVLQSLLANNVMNLMIFASVLHLQLQAWNALSHRVETNWYLFNIKQEFRDVLDLMKTAWQRYVYCTSRRASQFINMNYNNNSNSNFSFNLDEPTDSQINVLIPDTDPLAFQNICDLFAQLFELHSGKMHDLLFLTNAQTSFLCTIIQPTSSIFPAEWDAQYRSNPIQNRRIPIGLLNLWDRFTLGLGKLEPLVEQLFESINRFKPGGNNNHVSPMDVRVTDLVSYDVRVYEPPDVSNLQSLDVNDPAYYMCSTLKQRLDLLNSYQGELESRLATLAFIMWSDLFRTCATQTSFFTYTGASGEHKTSFPMYTTNNNTIDLDAFGLAVRAALQERFIPYPLITISVLPRAEFPQVDPLPSHLAREDIRFVVEVSPSTNQLQVRLIINAFNSDGLWFDLISHRRPFSFPCPNNLPDMSDTEYKVKLDEWKQKTQEAKQSAEQALFEHASRLHRSIVSAFHLFLGHIGYYCDPTHAVNESEVRFAQSNQSNLVHPSRDRETDAQTLIADPPPLSHGYIGLRAYFETVLSCYVAKQLRRVNRVNDPTKEEIKDHLLPIEMEHREYLHRVMIAAFGQFDILDVQPRVDPSESQRNHNDRLLNNLGAVNQLDPSDYDFLQSNDNNNSNNMLLDCQL